MSAWYERTHELVAEILQQCNTRRWKIMTKEITHDNVWNTTGELCMEGRQRVYVHKCCGLLVML